MEDSFSVELTDVKIEKETNNYTDNTISKLSENNLIRLVLLINQLIVIVRVGLIRWM